MLNEERIKLMTKMACYEANEGKKNVAIGNYFRGDYIAFVSIYIRNSALILNFTSLLVVMQYFLVEPATAVTV